MSDKKASPTSGTTTSSSSNTPTHTSSPIPQPMPPTAVPQVQVIQPLHSQPYLQHLYNSPAQLMLHGNLIQPGAIAQLQGITHNLSLQLTHNKPSPKSPTLIPNSTNTTKSPTLTNAVVTSKNSAVGPIQTTQMIATPGKPMLHGQPLATRVPTTSNQPLVINQLITATPSLLTAQLDSHLSSEAQAKQHYDIWNIQPAKPEHCKHLGQQSLQPKSTLMPAHMQSMPQPQQVFSGAQFVHSKMNSQPQLVACQPQIITSQPAMLTSQAQVINHFQAMTSIPPNISWTHASLPSPTTLLTTQTPIIIRSQQQDVFIQSPPTFQAQATATAQSLSTKVKQAVDLPTKNVTKHSISTGTKSVPAILPLHPNQTKVPSTHAWTSVSPSVTSKTAGKPRSKNQTSRSVQVTSGHSKIPHQPKTPVTIATTCANSSILSTAIKIQPEVKPPPLPKEPEMPVLEMAPTAALIVASSQLNHTKEESPSPPKDLPCANGTLETKPCDSPCFVDREGKKVEEETREPDIVKTEKPQPQKAIVKPQILTHVIEGYVIQEGPEPFPVNRSSLLTEFIPPKMTQAEKDLEEGKEQQGQEKNLFLGHKFSKKVPVEIAKCEFCGKMDIKARFKRSKRFCSTSCAKRYNVGCSKRLGLFTPSEPSKYEKKRKHTIKIRRGWKKGPRSPFLPNDKSQSPTLKEDEEEEESSSTPESQEDYPMSLEPPALQPMECELMDMDRPEPEKVPPAKWTVNDVSEFIRSLPGCKDYAEEFRIQEMDGQALMLLKEDHLMSAMSMKLGPALKICARINSLKEESM